MSSLIACLGGQELLLSNLWCVLSLPCVLLQAYMWYMFGFRTWYFAIAAWWNSSHAWPLRWIAFWLVDRCPCLNCWVTLGVISPLLLSYRPYGWSVAGVALLVQVWPCTSIYAWQWTVCAVLLIFPNACLYLHLLSRASVGAHTRTWLFAPGLSVFDFCDISGMLRHHLDCIRRRPYTINIGHLHTRGVPS